MSRGKHSSALSTGFYSKAQTLPVIVKTRNQHQGDFFMCLWMSNICSRELDVQKANISVSQFYRI